MSSGRILGKGLSSVGHATCSRYVKKKVCPNFTIAVRFIGNVKIKYERFCTYLMHSSFKICNPVVYLEIIAGDVR